MPTLPTQITAGEAEALRAALAPVKEAMAAFESAFDTLDGEMDYLADLTGTLAKAETILDAIDGAAAPGAFEEAGNVRAEAEDDLTDEQTGAVMVALDGLQSLERLLAVAQKAKAAYEAALAAAVAAESGEAA